jgi:murein DD-endopeptidase MepM/ murein hydrolase activator NlpD
MNKEKISCIILSFLFLCSLLLCAFDYKAPFIWPIRGTVITAFKQKYYDPAVNRSRVHTGIDIKGELHDTVYASANGYVQYIGRSPIGGMTIVIRHNETVKSNYLNLGHIYVKKGQYVKQGMPIAAIGAIDDPSSDSVHLHFAIVYKNAYLDPEDVLKIDYNSVSEYISLAYMPIDFKLK